MKRVILAAVAALGGLAAAAADAPVAAPNGGQVVYVPPQRGAPGGRTGGSTRGAGAALTIEALAPDHTGLTARPSPTLYWFAARPVAAPVQITLETLDYDQAEPLFEAIQQGAPAGTNAIDLARRGVALEPGRAYRWSVAVLVDPDRPAHDLVASATIQYQPAAVAAPGDAAALARAGYWYDALALLSGQAEQRAALLAQAGLAHVVALEQEARAR